jgi:PPK2 family polyphosphate:nucleotide phosphotransferase
MDKNNELVGFKIKPGTKINLRKLDTDFTGELQKEQSKIELDNLHLKMSKLQYKLHAEKKQALLIILQAMDAGGKDGTIRDVMNGFNPQGCKVKSFRAPHQIELDHDYLWRVHKEIPAKGEIGIFNRSHYGDILIVRIHNLVSKNQWSKRFDHINDFEKMLTDEGVNILKFYLRISKDEQKKRLEQRINNPTKHWKIDEADFAERKFWNRYMNAYEQTIEKCSTFWAPWHIIPSDKKWYRNLIVAKIITKTLEEMKLKFPKSKINLEKFENKSF